ncbi:hypothetical protein CVM52_15260 [Pseudooceanicola lipolyticus]|uniref:Uncharacterized protein n=1 Tax=Pseudooceanicola lipolyticus TaxID=2029104 RepID=A0A2M8IZ44_9RHOB|nr:hypothetical protein CVM52_15260 [Pseudooceanicola lipolyticus]
MSGGSPDIDTHAHTYAVISCPRRVNTDSCTGRGIPQPHTDTSGHTCPGCAADTALCSGRRTGIAHTDADTGTDANTVTHSDAHAGTDTDSVPDPDARPGRRTDSVTNADAHTSTHADIGGHGLRQTGGNGDPSGAVQQGLVQKY